MPTILRDGHEIDLFEILPPLEGEINIVYGRIGSGKTSRGTLNIWRELKDGNIIAANWKIDWQGYDEIADRWKRFLGYAGVKKVFYNFPRENFHHWNFANQTYDGKFCLPFVDQLTSLTDISIHLDEGHIPFDSYEATRMDEKKRSAVFAMRHFNRRLTVYTQRANSVHVNLRGNSNRFYKCEKLLDFTIPFFKKRIIRFMVTEFQDLKGGEIDETKDIDGDYINAVSQTKYYGSEKLFSKFDSKYLRGGMLPSQRNAAIISTYTLKEIWKNRFKDKGVPVPNKDYKFFKEIEDDD